MSRKSAGSSQEVRRANALLYEDSISTQGSRGLTVLSTLDMCLYHLIRRGKACIQLVLHRPAENFLES